MFTSSIDSRDTIAKLPPEATSGAFQAKSANERPITMQRKIRMKRPRDGSAAKACTEVRTPERTRNVPSSESEKVRIARNTVQILKQPRFSVTASEWKSAVPVSHGRNEEFSTGSQAHQPPQPSS